MTKVFLRWLVCEKTRDLGFLPQKRFGLLRWTRPSPCAIPNKYAEVTGCRGSRTPPDPSLLCVFVCLPFLLLFSQYPPSKAPRMKAAWVKVLLWKLMFKIWSSFVLAIYLEIYMLTPIVINSMVSHLRNCHTLPKWLRAWPPTGSMSSEFPLGSFPPLFFSVVIFNMSFWMLLLCLE